MAHTIVGYPSRGQAPEIPAMRLKGEMLEELHKLNRQLEKIGFSQSHPNPYYSKFSQALSRNATFRQREYSPEQYEKIQKRSDDILDRLLGEDDSK